MKHLMLYLNGISLFLLLVSLVGATGCFAADSHTVHKMSIYFSSNVQAELGPCG
jgi:hypothetical protein